MTQEWSNYQALKKVFKGSFSQKSVQKLCSSGADTSIGPNGETATWFCKNTNVYEAFNDRNEIDGDGEESGVNWNHC